MKTLIGDDGAKMGAATSEWIKERQAQAQAQQQQQQQQQQ